MIALRPSALYSAQIIFFDPAPWRYAARNYFFALYSAALRITQVLSTLLIGASGRSNMFPPR